MSSSNSNSNSSSSKPQALVSIALIGRNNEPLYLRDFPSGGISGVGTLVSSSPDSDNTTTGSNNNNNDISNTMNMEEDDPFGFMLTTTTIQNEDGSSSQYTSCLRHQFMVHASLDAFEEQVQMRQKAASSSQVSHDCYMGLLCPIEELRVYGYMTKTGVKIIIMLEDTLDFYQFYQQRETSNSSSFPGSASSSTNATQEAEIKSLFAKIHVLYVQYLMNPFAKLKGKITSKKFDQSILTYVEQFNK